MLFNTPIIPASFWPCLAAPFLIPQYPAKAPTENELNMDG